jgi:hypothetical protein
MEHRCMMLKWEVLESLQARRVFTSILTLFFKVFFILKIYQNNIFLFFKIYSCYLRSKQSKNIKKILILNKKFKFTRLAFKTQCQTETYRINTKFFVHESYSSQDSQVVDPPSQRIIYEQGSPQSQFCFVLPIKHIP